MTMVRFICEDCGNEKLTDIECHGHKISYVMQSFMCTDCNEELSEKEIEECIPKCCTKTMVAVTEAG